MDEPYEFDVFISHATEDKADFAEPLARELSRAGLRVWFDKFTLKVGDSLRDSIETGLSKSRYGVVIFSKHFLSKNWPKAELNGLFSREMENKKVILPIWHNISSGEIKSAMPIQADKVALRSSDGVASVAASIIEVVRPELLELDRQQKRVFDSAENFRERANERYPGYTFAVHSGDRNYSPAPGTIAVVKSGANQIDISISDRTLIEKEPILKITFSEEGAKKANDLYRTGKAQTWKAGEFTKIEGTFPMMPSGEVSPSMVMSARSELHQRSPNYVRVEVGAVNPTTFPFMEMRLVRAGAHEAEAIVRHSSTPLEVSFVFAVDGSTRVETAFQWDFIGHSSSACMMVVEAIDRLRRSDTIRLFDLQKNKIAIESPAIADQIKADPFSPELRRVLTVGAEAEKRFGATVRFDDPLTDEDAESLFYLDCLLNGRQYGTGLSVPLTLTKQHSEVQSAHELFLSGNPISLFLQATNFPGYFPLFGARIATPPWGLFTEECVLEDGARARARYDRAMVGDRIEFTVLAKTPTFVRWKAAFESSVQSSKSESDLKP